MAALRGDGLRAAILLVRMKGLEPMKQRKAMENKCTVNQVISKIDFSLVSFVYTLFCRKVLFLCFVVLIYFVPLQTKENKVK